MAHRKRDSIEMRIDEVYGIIAEQMKKRACERPTEIIDTSKPKLPSITDKVRGLIQRINDLYEGEQPEEFIVAKRAEGYDVILGIEGLFFHMFGPRTFYGEEMMTADRLKEKAEEGLYMKRVSFDEGYFRLTLFDATISEEIIIMTKKADVKPRRV